MDCIAVFCKFVVHNEWANYSPFSIVLLSVTVNKNISCIHKKHDTRKDDDENIVFISVFPFFKGKQNGLILTAREKERYLLLRQARLFCEC